MKGLIFTAFIQLAEDKFGLEMVDSLFLEVDTKTNGAYTNVGTYDHNELTRLAEALSRKTGTGLPELYRLFGFYLFKNLADRHPHIINKVNNPYEMFTLIDSVIHTEVKKLYAEAQVPRFEIKQAGETKLIMIYRSERKMADVAEGLINGCLHYFSVKGEVIQLKTNPDKSEVEFLIRFEEK